MDPHGQDMVPKKAAGANSHSGLVLNILVYMRSPYIAAFQICHCDDPRRYPTWSVAHAADGGGRTPAPIGDQADGQLPSPDGALALPSCVVDDGFS